MFRSEAYDIKKYFKFTSEEIRSILIGIVILAFIISFDEWGIEKFDVLFGLRNLFNAILIVTLAFIFRQAVQRFIAILTGFKLEYKTWVYGLIIAVVIVIISNGKLWFIAPGGIIVYHMAGHRLGSFRYGLNYWPVGIVGFMGPLSNLVLALVFKFLLAYFPSNLLLYKAMVFNIWFGVISMLPIPPLDGSHLFFASRLLFMFALGLIIGMSISLYFLGVFMSLLIGLIVGGLTWFSYTWFVEGK